MDMADLVRMQKASVKSRDKHKPGDQRTEAEKKETARLTAERNAAKAAADKERDIAAFKRRQHRERAEANRKAAENRRNQNRS